MTVDTQNNALPTVATNLLTNQFITLVSNRIFRLNRNKTERVEKEIKELVTDVLTTIWTINNVGLYDKTVTGIYEVKDYKVPAMFHSLVFEPITYDGTKFDNVAFTFTVAADVKGKVLTPTQMQEWCDYLYGHLNSRADMVSIADKSEAIRCYSNMGPFKAIDNEVAGIGFELGNYPLIPTLTGLINVKFGGRIAFEEAQYEWIQKNLKELG